MSDLGRPWTVVPDRCSVMFTVCSKGFQVLIDRGWSWTNDALDSHTCEYLPWFKFHLKIEKNSSNFIEFWHRMFLVGFVIWKKYLFLTEPICENNIFVKNGVSIVCFPLEKILDTVFFKMIYKMSVPKISILHYWLLVSIQGYEN